MSILLARQKDAGKKGRRHRHHHGKPRARNPLVSAAPDCHPSGARIPIAVRVDEWGPTLSCKVVRTDDRTREVVVALPDHLGWTPSAARGHPADIGWPDHNRWHEAKAVFAAPMNHGAKFFRLRIDSMPIHRERREFVRAKFVRPVTIYPGSGKVRAMTMDISEVAVRAVMGLHEPVETGNKVHLQLSFSLRAAASRGSFVISTLNLDGHVYLTRELKGSQAGKKEVVIMYEHMPASQRDFIRGLVYDWDLEHRNPGREDR